MRLLTPVYKAYYAKSMVGVCAELIEAFGGQGYIEDTGIPCLMRDVQVRPSGYYRHWHLPHSTPERLEIKPHECLAHSRCIQSGKGQRTCSRSTC